MLADVDVLIAPTWPSRPAGRGPRRGHRRAGPPHAREPDPLHAALQRERPPGRLVPCGFTAEGLPIGTQVIGRSFDEADVLRVADAYQRVTDWHTRRPPLGS